MADRYYNRTRWNRPYDYPYDYWDTDYGDFNRNFNDYGYNQATGLNRYRSSYDFDRGYGRYPTFNRGFNQYSYNTDWNDEFDYDTYPTVTYTEFWLIPGPFTGFGPQDYERSDENIKDDVHDRLTRHGHIDARKIHVDVKNGEVTLTGTVDSRQQKRMAEDVAESVSGVEDIHNQLKVQKQQGRSQSQAGHLQGNGMKNAIKNGMEVIGKNGRTIGTVKQVRQNDFLVNRPSAKDVFVPFNAAHLQQDKIQLDIPADQVEKEGWQTA